MCCISLACKMHRDMARIVNQCSDKLQRGTCAKNTVRFLKNDPSLACPQCTVRNIQLAAPLPSENLSCDNNGHQMADDSDLGRAWAQDDLWQPSPISQVQVPSSIPSRSRPASNQIDFQLPGYLHLDDDDLRELSHEDGIQLIDEMYGAENLHCSIEDIDMSDDEMFYVSAESYYDLEQAHTMINETDKIMQIGQKGAIADASIHLSQQHFATPTEVDEKKKLDIEASMFEARKLLDRAQQELDKLRQTEQEIEPDFQWCLDKYTTPTQGLIQGRL